MHSTPFSSKTKSRWDAATKGKKATTIYYIKWKSITYDLTVCNSGKLLYKWNWSQQEQNLSTGPSVISGSLSLYFDFSAHLLCTDVSFFSYSSEGNPSFLSKESSGEHSQKAQ